jgi:hypothetical protein
MMNFMFILAFVFMGTTVMFGALFGLCAVWTPAITFIKAKFKGGNVLMAIRRDRKADFTIGKYSSGMIETKKYGDYITDPDSVMNEKKSGARLFIASTELGTTISTDVAKIIQGLQEMKIPNLRIAKMINSQLHHCLACKKDVLGEPKMQEHAGKKVEWFECPICGAKGDQLQKSTMPIENLNIETLKFENLSKWSDTVMNPILQASNKELKVQEAIMDIQKPKLNVMLTFIGIGIMVFLICIGIWFLVTHIGGGGAATIINNPVTSFLNSTSGGNMVA